jgi:tocopherol O-methyltransferase
MITPKIDQTSAAVALHYNELDHFYREIWGNHVHHGYWRTGRETSDEAADALAELVAERLDLRAGMSACDIGCGYGETARLFASRYAVSLEGVTISESQFRVAAAKRAPGVTITLCDWLKNSFPDHRFDRAYAIESSEHIADKRGFFAEAYRVLRPGGRLVVCAWLAKSGASKLEQRLLLEPICRYGRLPGMGTEEDYRALAEAAGFDVLAAGDISANVSRTWTICVRRSAAKLLSDRRYREFLLAEGAQNKAFALTLFLIMAAYSTGAMRYCVFTYGKPNL